MLDDSADVVYQMAHNETNTRLDEFGDAVNDRPVSEPLADRRLDDGNQDLES